MEKKSTLVLRNKIVLYFDKNLHIFTLKGKPRKNVSYTLKASDPDGNEVVGCSYISSSNISQV